MGKEIIAWHTKSGNAKLQLPKEFAYSLTGSLVNGKALGYRARIAGRFEQQTSGRGGAGGIARMSHAAGWKHLADAAIVAVADVREDTAQALAKEFNIRHVFSDYQELVKLDLDAVDVCTPNQVHMPAVVAALETGKH